MPRLSTDSPEFRQASSLQSSPSLCSQIRTTRDNPGGHGTVTEQSNPCQLPSPDDAFCAPTQGPGPASQTPHVTHCVGLAVLHPRTAAAWSHPNRACLIKYWCKCHNTEMLCHLMPPSTVAVCMCWEGKSRKKPNKIQDASMPWICRGLMMFSALFPAVPNFWFLFWLLASAELACSEPDALIPPSHPKFRAEPSLTRPSWKVALPYVHHLTFIYIWFYALLYYQIT